MAELKCSYNNIPQFRSIFSCEKNVQAAAEMLEDAGFEVSVTKTDLGSKESILALVEYATGKGGLFPSMVIRQSMTVRPSAFVFCLLI